jgi:hypothetical protein
MKLFAALCLSLFFASCGTSPDSSDLHDTEGARFPTGPNHSVTPGETCQRPDTFRYPERIPYCNRNVSSSEKNAIINNYDRKFGYEVGRMNRSDFKVDHYIPLCMGGSNSDKNLWPQHKSVYVKTDPLEQKLCELMAAGRMLQAVAMDKIRYAKNNLDQADEMNRELDQLLDRSRSN